MINRYMYALLLGCVLIRKYPPWYVIWYTNKYEPITDDKEQWLVLSAIRNAPNKIEDVLFSMTIKTLDNTQKG